MHSPCPTLRLLIVLGISIAVRGVEDAVGEGSTTNRPCIFSTRDLVLGFSRPHGAQGVVLVQHEECVDDCCSGGGCNTCFMIDAVRTITCVNECMAGKRNGTTAV